MFLEYIIKTQSLYICAFEYLNMKKTLGLIITAIGILIIAGAFTLIPVHAVNAGDSVSGINAGAGLTYSGFIIFGIGIVLYISSLPYAGEKTK